MTDALQVTEDASAAVAVAPRITKAFIESQIAHELYITGDSIVAGAIYPDRELNCFRTAPDALQEAYAHHTTCILTTKSGFTVTGHSAPASVENFNPDLGRTFAYENAFRQLWPLFAFAMLECKQFVSPEVYLGGDQVEPLD